MAPLDIRLRTEHRVAIGEVRLHRDLRAHLLARGDQQRGLVRLGVEDAAHRVSDPRGGVQVDVRRAPARLREPVGHPHDNELLESEDVGEVIGEVLEHRQLGRPRIAEDRRHPVRAQQIEGGLANGRHHGGR
jgi:hypothetical protein